MKIYDKKRIIKLAWCMFIIYIVALAYFLFFSEHYGRNTVGQEYRYNLALFAEIKRFIQYRDMIGCEGFVVNIFGNVLAFLPFGFAFPLLNRRNRHFFYCTVVGLTFSVVIEGVQLITKVGIFDVDDIMMNTCGVILGYVIFSVSYRTYGKFQGKK